MGMSSTWITIVLLGAAASVLSASAQTPRSAVASRPYLEAALQTAAWLDSLKIETAHGLTWPVDPKDPTSITHDLYHGTCGIILFHLELYRATGNAKHLATAMQGADDLLATLPTEDTATEFGLWTGVAGHAYTLGEVFGAGGDHRYRDGFMRCLEIIGHHAHQPPDSNGVEWNDTTDIIRGSAGIGLLLLYASSEFDDRKALGLAQRAGDRLIKLGQLIELPDGTTGLNWAMTPDFPRLMPNFSHGAAGVCYYLATLHQELGAHGVETDDRYIDAAIAGARYLTSIADTSHDGCLIFHHQPDGEDLHYLGWCHGPAGTGRFFNRLAQATNDDSWRVWAHRGLDSLLQSGIPAQRTPGFWNNVGLCCGSAGVASFALEMAHANDLDAQMSAQAMALAEALTEDLLSRAESVQLADGKAGLAWPQAEHRVRPELIVTQTGIMQGAAGIGLWLLQLDAHQTGRDFELTLPISPY